MTSLSPTASGSFTGRFLRALPVVGRVIRDIERELDSVFYLLVILVTALILAVSFWGLPALVITAVAMVPVIFVLLICVTLP
jgi:fatty acid desaturase